MISQVIERLQDHISSREQYLKDQIADLQVFSAISAGLIIPDYTMDKKYTEHRIYIAKLMIKNYEKEIQSSREELEPLIKAQAIAKESLQDVA